MNASETHDTVLVYRLTGHVKWRDFFLNHLFRVEIRKKKPTKIGYDIQLKTAHNCNAVHNVSYNRNRKISQPQ